MDEEIIDKIVNAAFKIHQSTKDEIYRIKDEKKFETWAELFDTLIDKFHTPSDKNLSQELTKLQPLENENKTLKESIENLTSMLSGKDEAISQLQEQFDNLANEKTEIDGKVNGYEDRMKNNILISDPELVAELQLIRKAIIKKTGKEKTVNDVVAALLVACRQAGAFVIDAKLRKLLSEAE